MTEYGLSMTSLTSPLDFSRHRRQPQRESNPEPREAHLPSASVLDLRVRKVGEATDQDCRSMFEAYVASAGTPPSPATPTRASRSTSESTDDSVPRSPSPPHFQNSRQNPAPANTPRLGLNAPLYVNTATDGPQRPSVPDPRAPLSPAAQHSPTLQRMSDSTEFISGSAFTATGNRSFDASQYYAALRSLSSGNPQNWIQQARASGYHRLPPFSEISLDQTSRQLELPGQTGNDKEQRKSADFLPISVLAHDRISGPRPQTGSAEELDGSGSGSDCEQGQLPVSTGCENGKDEAYWERRRKNNEAAKKSRDARRAKEDEIAVKAAVLEKENICLKLNLAALKKEHQRLMHILK
nr:PREDICTED: uncharacterized protein LOC109033339 isoform X1 [Bemisia tabaci]